MFVLRHVVAQLRDIQRSLVLVVECSPLEGQEVRNLVVVDMMAVVVGRRHCIAVGLVVAVGLPHRRLSKGLLGNTMRRCSQNLDFVGLRVNHRRKWRVLGDWSRCSVGGGQTAAGQGTD